MVAVARICFLSTSKHPTTEQNLLPSNRKLSYSKIFIQYLIMSATREENSTNAVSNSNQPFSSKIAPSEPLTTSGVSTYLPSLVSRIAANKLQHQVGKKISEADKAPEFSAQVLPAGSAPADRTFQPQNDAIDPKSVRQDAQDTITGATTADVGAGVIPGGQSGSELHNDGQHHRKHERHGLEGVGANGQGGKLNKERAQ